MKYPAPFGYPAFRGIKRRVAKKILARRGRSLYARYCEFHNYPRDGIVRTCSGLNERLKSVEPSYTRVGRRGQVLFDIEFVTARGASCGLYSCGIELPITREQCQQYVENLVGFCREHGDSWGFAERYSKMTLHDDGTFTEGPGDA